MKATEQTLQQIERALRKAAAKITGEGEQMPLTDIYLQLKQESGELLIYDDDNRELTRCVVEEWMGNSSETFYEEVQPVLCHALKGLQPLWDQLPVLKPYSFVLLDEEGETVTDLLLVDDDLLVLDGELMKGLSEDLDAFWEKLSQR